MTLGKSTVAAFLVKVLGVLLFTGFTIVLARLVPKAEYGVIMFGIALISLLAPICLLGFDRVALKFAAIYTADADKPHLRGLYWRAVQITLGTTFVILLFALLAAFLGLYDVQVGMGQALFFAPLVLPFWAFVSLNREFQRGLKMVVAALAGFNLIRPAVALACVMTAVFFMPLTPAVVFVSLIIGLGVALMLDSWRIRKVLKGTEAQNAVLYENKLWAENAKPLLFSTVMNAILSRGDIVLIGLLLSRAMTGEYAAAMRLAGLLVFVLDTVRIVLAPHIAENAHRQDWGLMQREVSQAASWIFLATLPGAALLILFPEAFLSLFGDDYRSSATILIILSAGQLVSALAGPVGPLMTMTDLRSLHAWVMGLSTALFLILMFVLIRSFGIEGAAWAFFISTVLRNLTMAALIQRRLHIKSYARPLWLMQSFLNKRRGVVAD